MSTRKTRGRTGHRAAMAQGVAQSRLALAKITAPSSRRALDREALFARLDECADRRLIWLAAPAGYGKTTAVLTYLRARQTAPAWYQCDEGDADIASFFYYASLALRGLAPHHLPLLPDFSPDHFAAVPSFARQFFRAWFSRLPSGTVWVLDNWQDVPPDSPLAELLPLIVEETPEGLRLVVISRTGPAPNMSRLVANQQVAVLGEPDLRLTREETAALAAGYHRPAEQKAVLSADELYTATNGWAAGVAVMLRHDAETALPGAERGPRSAQSAFIFLSTEVFDRLSVEVRDLLIRTSCLEHVSVPVAEQILGRRNVRDMLDALVNQNAFTLYRPASDTFHYHPLFHAFLRDRLNATLEADAQRALRSAAAHSLVQHDDVEQAIQLFLQAGDWTEAAALIVRAAPGMAQQARFQTLAGWIAQLPPAFCNEAGWISYWHGVAQMVIDFKAARVSLDRAYALFVKSADLLGQMLSAAAILQHIAYNYVEFNSMLPWIERLDTLLRDAPSFPSPSVELHVMTGLVLALSQAQPTHPRLLDIVARTTRLLDEPVDFAGQAAGVAALLLYYGTCGHMAGYRTLDDRVVDLLKRPELAVGARLLILWVDSYQHFMRGQTVEANAMLDAADVIAREHRVEPFMLRIQVSRLQTWDYDRRADELTTAFAALEPALTRVPPMVAAHAVYLRAMYQLARGELSDALATVDHAAALIANSGWVIAESLLHIGKAEICVELERFDEAKAQLDKCDQLMGGLGAPTHRFNSGLIRAELVRRTRPPAEFAATLSQVLALGRTEGYAHSNHAYSRVLPRLIPYALELGIEVDYCRWLITTRGLTAPLADIPHWPWPVRIRAMGHLETFVDGAAIEFAGKSQRKPIDLLKLLLTRSAGIDTARLMDALWPDTDGDAARNAFDLTVHRLRKLLKHKDAILLTQGRLSLNPQLVWVDAFVLERLSAEGFAPEHLRAAVGRLMALYRAPFLADDEGADQFGARARLRSQFIRTVTSLADQLGKAGEYDGVETLCRQAVEAEPLEEPLYRIWIRSLLAQGHRAEAEAVYRRCEQTWSTLLNSKPSRATSQLLATPVHRD